MTGEAEKDPLSELEPREIPAPHDGSRFLPVLAFILPWIFFLGWGPATEYLFEGEEPPLLMWTVGILVVFVPVGLHYLLRRVTRETLVLDRDGIEARDDDGSAVRLGWNEIRSVQWTGFLSRKLVLSDSTGRRSVTLETHQEGFGDLAEEILGVIEAVRRRSLGEDGGAPSRTFRLTRLAWVPLWVFLLGTGVSLSFAHPAGWIVLAVLSLTAIAGQLGTLTRARLVGGWLVESGGVRWRRTPLARFETATITPPVKRRSGDRTYVDPPRVELRGHGEPLLLSNTGPDVLALWEATELARRKAWDQGLTAPPAPPRGRALAGAAFGATILAGVLLFGIGSGALLRSAVLFEAPWGVRIAEALGSDLDSPGLWEDPPLYDAVRGGNEELVALLLKLGADPGVREPDAGFTPLHRAARDGEIRIAEALMAAGAELEATTWRNSTPLSQAVFGGQPAMVRVLRDAGARIDPPGPGGQTPLNYAIREEDWELAGLLIELGARGDVADGAGFNPLQLAAIRGHLPTVRALVDRGTDPDAKGPTIAKPVALAASRGHPEVVAFLLDRGADSGATVEGMTLAEVARERGHERVVELLQRQDALRP